jgi:pullulanase/glycogen debranching enzyme
VHPSSPAPAWPGSHQPLGATWGPESTNFAVFAPEATGVELCLFDEGPDGEERESRLTLTEKTLGI